MAVSIRIPTGLNLALVLAVACLVIPSVAHAQQIDTGSVRDSIFTLDQQPGVLEKLLFLGGACVAYAGIDYVGYNLTKQHRSALLGYRVFQVLMQGAISWVLYDQLGLPAAIGFNVIWWTFGLDFLYYGYAELLNPGHPWESRGDLQRGIFSNRCNWAYWTPVGIARGVRRDAFIPGDTLVAQSLVGLILGLSVTIAF